MIGKLSTVVLVLGLLAGIGYIVARVVADSDSDKHALHRLPAAEGVVSLPSGEVGVWYRERVRIDEAPDEIEPMPLPPGLQVRVRAAGGAEVPQKAASGLFRIGGTGDMEAQLLTTMVIPAAGRYSVLVRPPVEGRRDAGIGFGTAPSLGSSLRHLAGGAIIMAGAVLAFLLLRLAGRILQRS